ncbi:MAG TPA: hypothetical protein EYM39_04885 [Candidatus Latescibacteria bacterium]|nr:hypothetical protein [Candidatus Latescibacterota bacterium]
MIQFPRIVSSAFCVSLLASATVGASELSTNIDLVVATARQAVRDGLADLDSAGEELSWHGRVLLLPQEEAEENWIVEHLLLEELLSRGFEVTLDSTASGSDGVELSYRIVDLSVTGSSGILGGHIERRCRLPLALRLTSGGELRWQTEAKSEIADFVPKSRIEVLQSSSYDFADTELEEKNWGKFVEPIIVSAVLGSLIYIFFTNR